MLLIRPGHDLNRDRLAAAQYQQFQPLTLLDAAQDKGSVLSNEDRPWVLLRPKAISLARMERFRDINELDSFVRAGVALTRTFKFGRPV